jgi:lysophospholipase L1-like esterase
MSKKLVVLVGDSIRMGYQPRVTELLSDVAEVWGPEENGGNSANLLKLAHLWVLHRQPDFVHFNCGLHDLRTILYGGRENVVPIGHYQANLEVLVRLMKEKTGARLAWATITPVIDDHARAAHARSKDFDRYEEDVARYNAAALEVMAYYGVEIHDLHAKIESRGTAKLQSGDGVHYTDEANIWLGGEVADFIRARL